MGRKISRKDFITAKGNLVETATELKEIKETGFDNVNIIKDDSSEYPHMTYKIVDKHKKVIVRGTMLEDIFSFRAKKTKRGKIMHLLREVEETRRKEIKGASIVNDFKSKTAIFKANIKIPEHFKLRKHYNHVSIIIPDKRGHLNKKYFGFDLNHEELAKYKTKTTTLTKIKYLQHLSKDIDVEKKTAFRRGAKFTYTNKRVRLAKGDSIAVVMTYEIKEEYVKRFGLHHDVGRTQSHEHSNDHNGREKAEVEAWGKLELILQKYGIVDTRSAVKNFHWTFRTAQLGTFRDGVRA